MANILAMRVAQTAVGRQAGPLIFIIRLRDAI